VIGIAIIGSFSQADEFFVMLSEALQRNVKHEARLSNISDFRLVGPDYELRFFAPLRMTDYDGSICRRLPSLR
jgi:hypothetical protein